MRLPEGTPPDAVVAVHPTQLYEVALAFLILWYLWRRREARFLIEFVRAKDDRLLGPLTLAPMLSLVVVLLGGWLMTDFMLRRRQRPSIVDQFALPVTNPWEGVNHHRGLPPKRKAG